MLVLCHAVSLLRIQESQPYPGLLQVGSGYVSVHSAADRLIVEQGFTSGYDHALQTMQELPYNRWRFFNELKREMKG
jgi:hypothetical protein